METWNLRQIRVRTWTKNTQAWLTKACREQSAFTVLKACLAQTWSTLDDVATDPQAHSSKIFHANRRDGLSMSVKIRNQRQQLLQLFTSKSVC